MENKEKMDIVKDIEEEKLRDRIPGRTLEMSGTGGLTSQEPADPGPCPLRGSEAESPVLDSSSSKGGANDEIFPREESNAPSDTGHLAHLGDRVPEEEEDQKIEERKEEISEILDDEEEESCLFGCDVVPLFPSLTSKRTGEIIRDRILKSKLEFKGFDDKQGRRYIVMNKDLTTDMRGLRRTLPWRRKEGGSEPGMSGRIGTKLDDDPEDQWVFPERELDDQEKSLKASVAGEEKKAHENWVAARQAERKLTELTVRKH